MATHFSFSTRFLSTWSLCFRFFQKIVSKCSQVIRILHVLQFLSSVIVFCAGLAFHSKIKLILRSATDAVK